MERILWLPSWYPNKLFPFNGDFIQRHAMAVSLHLPVHVIFVIKDERKEAEKISIERIKKGNLDETIVYIKPFRTGLKSVDKIISILTYLKTNKQLVAAFIAKEGSPLLVHVHVSLWAGMIALWSKKKYNIPYLITEHWTGYDRKADDNVYKRDFIFRRSLKKVLQKASILLPVGERLGKLITDNFEKVPYKVISNVVDTSYFKWIEQPVSTFRFIHISGMNYQKNCEGILRSFANLLSDNINAELVMIGPAGDGLKSLSYQLGLEKKVRWVGEIPYPEVAKAMQLSSCLVMFSRFENLPCVILEALCCGLPVVTTNVGDITSVVDESNGILVTSENEEMLLKAMKDMTRKYHQYDKQLISASAIARFNYDTIGKAIADEYQKLPGA